ncbi:c-type cytochrome [Caballeronia sp. LP006]|uniref:c-type cytochrome n=1 Tax=unclassified Caballeronia TaxID=2646786 RepID=UPI0020297323|nr:MULTISPECIES: c-type cytochrome [unclassified Caballeronia]MDR5775470.1 c-type cytochrome [Caballeronia sp. LZ002]MDR5801783.1 c-type cytochrome [Caballeronia sp. LZ001]MDR5828745.1 c-type cytochrome [Caballeronia sp. LP006]MDR5850908.1 c-type cytochrome [Caballeronia sp. LZ003]
MSDERLFTFRNRWFATSVLGMIGIAVVSALIGFVWLPSVHRDEPFTGVWNAICSAAGVPRSWYAGEGGKTVEPTVTLTGVEVTPQLLVNVNASAVGRGATLALRCTMCHGERGMSEANSPNLAGQYASVIYKQLIDFQKGARNNAVMSPMAVNLSDQDMRDLAAYYASLPRPPAQRKVSASLAPSIVSHGAPMRNIAPCATCHGGIDSKAGSPWLDGLPAAYTKAQLTAFANGTRTNDINEVMRNVARNMTPDEIEAAAAYYARELDGH